MLSPPGVTPRPTAPSRWEDEVMYWFFSFGSDPSMNATTLYGCTSAKVAARSRRRRCPVLTDGIGGGPVGFDCADGEALTTTRSSSASAIALLKVTTGSGYCEYAIPVVGKRSRPVGT